MTPRYLFSAPTKLVILTWIFIPFFSTSQALAAGTLSGEVVDAADGTTPVNPVVVDLADPVTGNWLDINAVNNPDGSWEISGLAPGNYKIFFNAVGAAEEFADELYDGVLCDNGACDVQNLGDIYLVEEGANVLDVDLAVVGVLGGTVVDEADGTPVHPVVVDLADPDSGEWMGFDVLNNPDGSWQISGLAPGSYKVFFNALGDAEDYRDELYDGIWCDNGVCDVASLGTNYVVTAGNNNLDIDLGRSRSVSGTVTNESAEPVEGVRVAIFNSYGVQVGEDVLSDSSGQWSSSIPANGSYYVRAGASTPGLESRVWNNLNCAGCKPEIIGDPIVINSSDVVDIDFLLCASGELIFSGGFELLANQNPEPASCSHPDSVSEYWKYWLAGDVRAIDSWGDSDGDHRDIVATYAREEDDRFVFRIDFFDLQSPSVSPTYFGVDYKTGGVNNVLSGNHVLNLDMAWDLLVVADGTDITAYDSGFNVVSVIFSDRVLDRHVDFISFGVPKTAMDGWPGGAVSIQALTPFDGSATEADLSPAASTRDTAGTAKLILPFMNATLGNAPYNINRWDGYGYRPEVRPEERRGLKYLLEAADRYHIPFTLNDLRVDQLAGNEFLGILDRLRALANRGGVDLIMNMNYGHFMSWWPDIVDRNAIELNASKRVLAGIPGSDIFYPYETIITPADIEVIKEAGFSAVWGLDQFLYWFGVLEDWSDPEVVASFIKQGRKIHRINDLDFIFDTASIYGGHVRDDRWEEPDWSQVTFRWFTNGTDQGLHSWFRRTLLEMAADTDQQQFFTYGTDIELSEWMFEDAAEWNFKWMASHPWIEVITFSKLMSLGWDVIDHGTLALGPDDMLSQHRIENDGHYNAYITDFYYGGTSDGHSPIVPVGVEIEGFFEAVPILRDGLPIPSGKIMGDHKTPGTIIYETIQNLQAMPDNPLAELAWLSFHHSVGEITFHEAEKLHPWSKDKINYVGHTNKIVAAAHWAEAVRIGSVTSDTVVAALDLDLDGEDEYTISNDKVFAILENDGGRVEYAFAYDADHGPVQLVAPHVQSFLSLVSDDHYLTGESGISAASSGRDAAFSEDLDGGDFNYSLMNAAVGDGSLSFETGDENVRKVFTLSGNQLWAEYFVTGIPPVTPGFGFAVNMLGMYNRNWDHEMSEVNTADERGWRSGLGGYASVNLGDSAVLKVSSFMDSPAGLEMQERDDPGTYPEGHYKLYPHGFVETGDQVDSTHFTIGITLRADSGSD